MLLLPAGLYAINGYLKFMMLLYFAPTTAKMLGNLKASFCTQAQNVTFLDMQQFPLHEKSSILTTLLERCLEQYFCMCNTYISVRQDYPSNRTCLQSLAFSFSAFTCLTFKTCSNVYSTSGSSDCPPHEDPLETYILNPAMGSPSPALCGRHHQSFAVLQARLSS